METDNQKMIRLTCDLENGLTEDKIRLLGEHVEKCRKMDNRDGEFFPERSFYTGQDAYRAAASLLNCIRKIKQPYKPKTHNAAFHERRTKKYY